MPINEKFLIIWNFHLNKKLNKSFILILLQHFFDWMLQIILVDRQSNKFVHLVGILFHVNQSLKKNAFAQHLILSLQKSGQTKKGDQSDIVMRGFGHFKNEFQFLFEGGSLKKTIYFSYWHQIVEFQLIVFLNSETLQKWHNNRINISAFHLSTYKSQKFYWIDSYLSDFVL